MKSIADRWQQFEREVLPAGAPQIQRTEMRRAFYAGWQAALTAGVEASVECGDNDDIGATLLERQWEECRQFALDVQAGRA